MDTYTIDKDGHSITCHKCGRTSHNLNDVRHLYCGHCHVFHEDVNWESLDEAFTRLKLIVEAQQKQIERLMDERDIAKAEVGTLKKRHERSDA